jgi:hypothetical protein
MPKILTVNATPEPIAIDPAKTAVIVVDMQNDFGSKGGMFDRAGIDISGIQRAVAPTAMVLAGCAVGAALKRAGSIRCPLSKRSNDAYGWQTPGGTDLLQPRAGLVSTSL